jgi:sugar phosphate isomerase/epimerase
VKKPVRIGIDNYGLDPLGMKPLEILEWAAENGAEGVHFSGLSPQELEPVDASYLKELTQAASSRHMYIEWGGGQHIPFDTETWERRDIVPINRRAAEQAAILGTRIVRSCSGGLMRWRAESPMTETLLLETANALRSQKSLLTNHNVILAIETHFEFTTHELLRLFDMCEAEPGDYLGVCFDTMNVMTLLEDPLEATQRILPWIVSTHVKDGALLLSQEGFVSFPVEIGRGVVNLKTIIDLIQTLPHEVNFSVEDHGGQFSIPFFDPAFLDKFPDLTLQEFVKLIKHAEKSQEAVERRELSITDRKDWPDICESRMKKDLENLKKINS